jgi:hypothetical protein
MRIETDARKDQMLRETLGIECLLCVMMKLARKGRRD